MFKQNEKYKTVDIFKTLIKMETCDHSKNAGAESKSLMSRTT